MIRSVTPSLRHFAVIESAAKFPLGRTYLVQDRRDHRSQQLLFMPNRLIAWPRYLGILMQIAGQPVRLRNGKVAILFAEGVTSEEFAKELKGIFKGSWRFDALNGFTIQPVPRKWLISFSMVLGMALIGGISYTALALGAQPKTPSVALLQTKTSNNVCVESLDIGSRFFFESKGIRIVGSDKTLRVMDWQQLGGYFQARTKSDCTGKFLTIHSWLAGQEYEVRAID